MGSIIKTNKLSKIIKTIGAALDPLGFFSLILLVLHKHDHNRNQQSQNHSN